MTQQPEPEIHRLAAMARYAALDAECDPVFDRIIELTRLIFGAPAATISLAEPNRVRFRSQTGTDIIDLFGGTLLSDHLWAEGRKATRCEDAQAAPLPSERRDDRHDGAD